MESQCMETSTSPIEEEIKKLSTKVERLTNQLARVLTPITESKSEQPNPGGILGDLRELNERLGNILDRLQV